MLVKSSAFGLLCAALPSISRGNGTVDFARLNLQQALPHERYPAIPLEIAAEVVGVAHFNLQRLKELVDPRPELANAIWDWGFGDWESAMGAASHVGRRDIVDYLIQKGAMPTIFTFAVLGEYAAVKAMIETRPGIQKNLGPHGISLLRHAKQAPSTEGVDAAKATQLIEYLEALGDADGPVYLNLEEADKAKYLGDYRFGDGPEDGFTIKLNMRKMLAMGRLGKSGGALYRIGEQEFTVNGAPSVKVAFKMDAGRVVSLTLIEPGLELTAEKVG